MKVSPVVNWMIRLTVLAILLAGGAGYYVWSQSDQLVSSQILKRFHELAPDLALSMDKATLQGTDAVELQGIEIAERATGKSVFRARRVLVDINSDRLVDHQQIVIDRVHVRSPDLLVVRNADGRWNWQNYQFEPPKTAGPPPPIIIEDARLQLTLKHGPNIPPAQLLLSAPELRAIPASAHSWDFEGGFSLPGAGTLTLQGAADTASQTWKLVGKLKDVGADSRLMELAVSVVPSLQARLNKINQTIASTFPAANARVIAMNDRTVKKDSPAASLQLGQRPDIAPRFLGRLDVNFEVSSRHNQTVPDFKLLVDVRDGYVATDAFPFECTDVKARFYRDNDNLEFQLVKARLDSAELQGSFLMSTAPNAAPPSAGFSIRGLTVDDRVRPLLPIKTARLFDAYQPEGSFSATGQIVQSASGRWLLHNTVVDIHPTTVRYHKFDYPTQIRGTLKQQPLDPASQLLPAFEVQLDGQFEQHPFTVAGWWKNPGEQSELQLQLDITDFPVDSAFRNALSSEQQKVIDALNLSGAASAAIVFYRPPGLNQLTHPFVKARVKRASMKLNSFPYPISDLSGDLTYHGPTKSWTFENLKGSHGTAKLQASGRYVGLPAPGVLDLKLKATDAPLDADLYNALAEAQRNIWNLLNPSGFCDLTADIHWTAVPGRPPVIRFPATEPVRIYNTRIKPDPFPYELDIAEAVVSFDPNDASKAGAQRCEIHSFKAFHNQSPVRASGWFEAKANREWQLHLSNVRAEQLKPDDDLRAALPASWRTPLDRLHRSGTIGVVNSELDFRGDIDGSKQTTARWKMNLLLNDCTVNAGLDVSEVSGQVSADGVWDGFHLKNVGQIQLDTAVTLEMPFTNVSGPYSVNDIELVLGARRLFEPNQLRNTVPRTERIQADGYGGSLLLDAVVDLSPEGRYQFFSEIENARLESYAALHIPDQPTLRGVVTAWMYLKGFGDDPADVTGRGGLRISPAALYELPVMMKVLGSLSKGRINVQNLTAFTYALVQFDVADKLFKMNRIDLVGEEISFRGQGTVGFEGAVELDFYSGPAQKRTLAIPFLNELFTSWTKIEVRGTTDRPQTTPRPIGQLDEGLRQFLQPFNPRPNGPIPTLQIPQFFPGQPINPLRSRTQSGQASGTPDITAPGFRSRF